MPSLSVEPAPPAIAWGLQGPAQTRAAGTALEGKLTYPGVPGTFALSFCPVKVRGQGARSGSDKEAKPRAVSLGGSPLPFGPCLPRGVFGLRAAGGLLLAPETTVLL